MNTGFRLFGNKYFEMQLELGNDMTTEWLSFSVGTRSNQDHAGLFLYLELFKWLFFAVTVCDNRHWNEKECRWYEDGEQNAEHAISEERLLKEGFEKRWGIPSFSGRCIDNPSYAMGVPDDKGEYAFKSKVMIGAVGNEFYSKSISGSLIVRVYLEDEVWRMTDNWTQLNGPVSDIHGVFAWEDFLKNKKLY